MEKLLTEVKGVIEKYKKIDEVTGQNFNIFNVLEVKNYEHTLKDLTKDNKILLFDDINTTGSTLREMIRELYAINDTLNFEIYTIIGKG